MLNKLFCSFLLLGLIAGLPGCSILKEPEPLDLITLRTPLPEVALCETPMPSQIVVVVPDMAGGLRTDRIATLFDEREIRYLAGAKWEAQVPALIQRQLVRYLNATGCFSGAGTEAAGLSSRYRLQSDLQRLHLCYYGKDAVPYAEITLRLSILDAERGRILEARTITFREKSRGTEMNQLMDALDNVVYRAMLDSARWTASVMRVQTEPAQTEPSRTAPKARK